MVSGPQSCVCFGSWEHPCCHVPQVQATSPQGCHQHVGACTNLPLHAVTFSSSGSKPSPHSPTEAPFPALIRLAAAQFLVYHPVVNSGKKNKRVFGPKARAVPGAAPSRMQSGLSCSCTRVAQGGQAPKENQAKPNPTNWLPFLQSAEYRGN